MLRHEPLFRRFNYRLFLSLREVRTCSEYLEYCRVNQLPVDSAIFRGTLYEFSTKEKLESIMNCRRMVRVGGAGDHGVDLIGNWNLSEYDVDETAKLTSRLLLLKSKLGGSSLPLLNLEDDIIALVQCKNYASRIKASTIRELAGIYEYHVKTKLDTMRVFFFLVSPYPLTKQAQVQMDTSKVPIVHIKLLAMNLDGIAIGNVENTELETSEEKYQIERWSKGSFKAAYMNKTAAKLLTGLNVQRKYALMIDK